MLRGVSFVDTLNMQCYIVKNTLFCMMGLVLNPLSARAFFGGLIARVYNLFTQILVCYQSFNYHKDSDHF